MTKPVGENTLHNTTNCGALLAQTVFCSYPDHVHRRQPAPPALVSHSVRVSNRCHKLSQHCQSVITCLKANRCTSCQPPRSDLPVSSSRHLRKIRWSEVPDWRLRSSVTTYTLKGIELLGILICQKGRFELSNDVTEVHANCSPRRSPRPICKEKGLSISA